MNENTDLVISNNGRIRLSPEETDLVIHMFAKGSPRSEVVKILSRNYPEAHPTHEEDYRQKLSGYLRKYDPTSTGFSQKYAERVEIVRQEIRDTLGNTYQDEVRNLQDNLLAQVKSQMESLSCIDARIDALNIEWQQARHNTEQQGKGQARYTATFNEVQHRRLIEIDKQIQKWHEIRLKEEIHLANLFFALKNYETTIWEKLTKL